MPGCRWVDGPPSFELRKGIVYITDHHADGECTRAMLLGDFVAAVKRSNALAKQWVAEANVVEMRE